MTLSLDRLPGLIQTGRFQRSLSVVAGVSSLLSGLEVTYEHYRGSYSQRIMYSPVLISLALFLAGLLGALNRRAARTVLPLTSLVTVLDGIVGFVFHVRGVHRKPGGWRVPVFNVIMGPPIFAPLLFAVSGYLGLMASLLRREDDPPIQPPGTADSVTWLRALSPTAARLNVLLEGDVHAGRFQRHLAAVTALAALLSGLESLYSHYKNNFRYGVQWTPILVTPCLVAAGIGPVRSPLVARTLLPAASLAALANGGVGFFYHARGVLLRPGGLKYPLYNVMYGPPIFAPLLFAASGFLGLLASVVRRER